TGRRGNFNYFFECYSNDRDVNYSPGRSSSDQVGDSSVAFGDIDNDGDLDILLTGFDNGNRFSKTYINENGTYTEKPNQLLGIEGSAVFGDINNDGNLDILLTGRRGNFNNFSDTYINDGNGNYSPGNTNLVEVGASSVAFGDIDSDGDLDILLTGYNKGTSITKTYRNTSTRSSNTAPSAPIDLVVIPYDDNTVSLSWTASTDDETPSDGLSYNIYIKETLSAKYAFTPMSQELGWRKLPALGNAQGNTNYTWKIPDNYLDKGAVSFTFKVQAIDHNFEASEFSIKENFVAPAPHFTEITNSLPGVYGGSVAFGDINNDGNMDILLTGYDGSNAISKTYINDDGNGNYIVKDNPLLTGVQDSSVAFGDINNDGNLDILLTGQDSDNRPISNTYINDGNGDYTVKPNQLEGVKRGSVAFGDIDNDGDLDILLTGYDGSKAISKTYTNYGDGSYIVKENPLITGVYDGSVAFGDIDNDGDLDILLSGDDGSGSISKIYINTGTGDFIEIDSLTEARYSSVAFGDIDNDGDLDILLTGWDENNPISKTYRNNRKIPNTAPSAPANPKATFNANDNTVDLSWDESTDPNQTKGLSYNIYIKDNYNTKYAVIPMAQMDDGWRKLPALGNAQGNTNYTWKIPDNYLDNGAVLLSFKVQAIDHNFKASEFSSEVKFRVTGLFTEITNSLTRVYDGSVAFGDINNDGNLDILLSGEDSNSNLISKTYINDGDGGFSFNQNLEGAIDGSVAFGDIDNDGYLDILITGWNSNPISKTYINDGYGNYILKDNPLTGVQDSSVAFGDIDNDGDLDILLAGKGITETYVNNGKGDYVIKENTELQGVFRSSTIFGDINNDGYLDILLTGSIGFREFFSKTYINDGTGFFKFKQDLEGVNESSTAFGDIDNDGDLDILLSGTGINGNISKIYTNDGTGIFEYLLDLEGTPDSATAFGDIDSDGDLDILLTGDSISKIYRNNSKISNTAPSSPTDLEASVNYDNTVNLSWTASLDNETPSAGLSYNVYIKENPVVTPKYVATPMAQESDGWRKLPALGNAQGNTNYTWKIPEKHYGLTTDFTFKVQAIDHNFAGSLFSSEGSFTANPMHTIFVNSSVVSGINNGTSWATAYATLQDALTNVSVISGNQIWIAAGTYKPTDENTPFNISGDVKIYGGFAGDETSLSQRNWNINRTILSGDLDSSSTANVGDAHSVIKISTDNVVLDGFIIEYGYADGKNIDDRYGAGLYIKGVSSDTDVNNAQITNCIIRNNKSPGTVNNGAGGGVALYGDNHTFTNCLFYDNSSSSEGGALSLRTANNLNLINCTFAQNTAKYGGAVFIHTATLESTEIINSIFYDNIALTNNPNIYNNDSGNTVKLSFSLLDTELPAAGGTVINIGNNIVNTDPLFTNAPNDIFTLQNNSPAIDVGDNSVNLEGKALGGNDRKINKTLINLATIDIGAYETLATSSPIECFYDAMNSAPTTLPVMQDGCGNVITAPAPVITGTATNSS
ncbi:MAG: hypothetical protein GY787_34270, partial [Alteromonadales bacterium]|nr:hypothetical protein [Alteromonadales bacterium]